MKAKKGRGRPRKKGAAVPDALKNVEHRKDPSIREQMEDMVKRYDPATHSEEGKAYNDKRTRDIRINARMRGHYATDDVARIVVQVVLGLVLLVPACMAVFSMALRLRRFRDIFEAPELGPRAVGTAGVLWWIAFATWWCGHMTWHWLVLEMLVAAAIPGLFLSYSPLVGALWWLLVFVADWHHTVPAPLNPLFLYLVHLQRRVISFEPAEPAAECAAE